MPDPLFEDNIADLYDNTDEHDRSTSNGLDNRNLALLIGAVFVVLVSAVMIIAFAPPFFKAIALMYLGVAGWLSCKGVRQGWRNII